MQSKAQFLAQLNTGLKVTVTDGRSWWGQGKNNIKVVTEEVNPIIVNQNPLNQICNGRRNKGGGMKFQWEQHIHKILSPPLHP